MPRLFKNDWTAAAGFFAAALVLRILFATHTVYNWDAGDFALGLERYSIPEFQPHPPGYILYTALGRLVNFFVGDAGGALAAISIVGGAAAVAGIFLLGRSMFDRTTGIVAGFLLLFSPSAWYYSEIQLTYSLELFLAIIATWLLYQMFFYRRYTLAAAVFIGIAGGFRQDILLFLGPFWFIASFRAGRREMLVSWAAMAASVLVWFVPLLYFSGGIEAYRVMDSEQWDVGVYPYSVLADGFSAFRRHLQEVWRGAIWLFGLGTIMLVYALSLLPQVAKLKEHKRVLFLLVLQIPALSFFLLFLFNPPGYLLIIAAPLVLLLARLIAVNAEDIQELFSRGKKTVHARMAGNVFIAVALTVIAAANTVLFTRAGSIDQVIPSTGGPVSAIFGPYSWGSIDQAGHEIDTMKGVMSRYNPEDTAIVVTILSDWRRLMYYFPDYHVYPIRIDDPANGYCDSFHHYYVPVNSRNVALPKPVKQLIFFKMDTSPTKATPVTGTSAPPAITRADVPENGSLRVGAFTFTREQ